MEKEDWCAEVHGFAKSQRGLSNWTELKCTILLFYNVYYGSGSVKIFLLLVQILLS